jgi:hypothetical protein
MASDTTKDKHREIKDICGDLWYLKSPSKESDEYEIRLFTEDGSVYIPIPPKNACEVVFELFSMKAQGGENSMNGGEVWVCDSEYGCGEPFEIKRSKIGDTIICPYCGEIAGPQSQ